MTSKITQQTLYGILAGDDLSKDQLRELLDYLVDVSGILEGSGAPTFQSIKHQQYFDTVASKYYRNTDGGTAWAALN